MSSLELNNIYNRDCYQAIKEIEDKSIDLIITDPPYDIEQVTGGGMLEEKRIKNMFNTLKDKSLNVGIDKSILDEMCRVMKKINIYVWCNKKMLPMLFEYFVGEKGCLFDLIVWHKTNAMPLCGSKYLTDCEYCLYFYEPGIKLNTTYDTAHTVYNKPINQADKDDFLHPTIKPLDIISNFIINSSNEGDIVFDPFMGSGTTAVAAKEAKRKYLGFEIDEEYYKIATDRLAGITANGQTTLDLFGGED